MGELNKPVVLPDKHLFKIGEVARLSGLKAHVLRYWETEFPQLRPDKTASKHRLYTRRDVENVLLIRQLLYRDGFTIAGARRRLREVAKTPVGDGETVKALLARVRVEVEQLLETLEDDT